MVWRSIIWGRMGLFLRKIENFCDYFAKSFGKSKNWSNFAPANERETLWFSTKIEKSRFLKNFLKNIWWNQKICFNFAEPIASRKIKRAFFYRRFLTAGDWDRSLKWLRKETIDNSERQGKVERPENIVLVEKISETGKRINRASPRVEGRNGSRMSVTSLVTILKQEKKNKQDIQQRRVWSWLRMNASDRLNTCKSRGSGVVSLLNAAGDRRTGE